MVRLVSNAWIMLFLCRLGAARAADLFSNQTYAQGVQSTHHSGGVARFRSRRRSGRDEATASSIRWAAVLSWLDSRIVIRQHTAAEEMR